MNPDLSEERLTEWKRVRDFVDALRSGKRSVSYPASTTWVVRDSNSFVLDFVQQEIERRVEAVRKLPRDDSQLEALFVKEWNDALDAVKGGSGLI